MIMIIAFVCLLVVSLATGTLYCIYSHKQNIVGVTAKISAILSCCLLALVTANLTSAIGGYSIFVILGLIILLCHECLTRPDLSENKGYFYFKNLSLTLGIISFFVAGIVLGSFNVFAFLCGLFVGGGLILLNFALTRKEKGLHELISESILLGFLGLLFGQGITLVMSPSHLLVGVFFLVGSIFVTAGQTMRLIKKQDNNIIRIVGNAVYILGLIAISSSIYFL